MNLADEIERLRALRSSIHSFIKARAYQQAEQDYLERRGNLASRRASSELHHPD
jgi:hypothetical protein